MKRAAIRVCFTLAAAIVAAAVADPLVEATANAGVFGPGTFTDHSMLDVVPALISGAALIGVCFVLHIRRELLRASVEVLRSDIGALLPALFATQIAVLFVMETIEQVIVIGHPLGGTIWLGGPVCFSLAVHAVACVVVALALADAICACARTTMRMIRRIRALAMRALHDPAPLALRRRDRIWLTHDAPVRCGIGKRAPPFAFV